LDDGAAEPRDEAEDIINAAGPRIMEELGVDRDREKAPGGSAGAAAGRHRCDRQYPTQSVL